MADAMDGQRVGKAGAAIVALVTVAAVAGAVVLTFARDDKRSTPVEDYVAGRTTTVGTADPTDSDPLVSDNEAARPQGREAPDSREGVSGAGSSALTRDTPALNPGTAPGREGATVAPNTGRNAPASPGAADSAPVQRAPENDLRDGANVDAERGRELR